MNDKQVVQDIGTELFHAIEPQQNHLQTVPMAGYGQDKRPTKGVQALTVKVKQNLYRKSGSVHFK